MRKASRGMKRWVTAGRCVVALLAGLSGELVADSLGPTAAYAACGGDAYATAVVADTPYSYWEFSESSGNAADCRNGWDVSPGSGGGAPTEGASGLVQASGRTSWSFASGNYAQRGGYVQNQSGVSWTNITFEYWMASTATAGPITNWSGTGISLPGSIVFDTYVCSNNLIAIGLENGHPSLSADRSGASWASTLHAVSTKTVNDGNPHYVAWTVSGTSWTLYVDGNSAPETFTNAGTAAYLDNSDQIVFGDLQQCDSGRVGPYVGRLSDFAIYKGETLTGTQVQNHYSAGVPPCVKYTGYGMSYNAGGEGEQGKLFDFALLYGYQRPYWVAIPAGMQVLTVYWTTYLEGAKAGSRAWSSVGVSDSDPMGANPGISWKATYQFAPVSATAEAYFADVNVAGHQYAWVAGWAEYGVVLNVHRLEGSSCSASGSGAGSPGATATPMPTEVGTVSPADTPAPTFTAGPPAVGTPLGTAIATETPFVGGTVPGYPGPTIQVTGIPVGASGGVVIECRGPQDLIGCFELAVVPQTDVAGRIATVQSAYGQMTPFRNVSQAQGVVTDTIGSMGDSVGMQICLPKGTDWVNRVCVTIDQNSTGVGFIRWLSRVACVLALLGFMLTFLWELLD